MDSVDPKLITPMLLGIVVVLAIYRRVRRSFGRQPMNTRRLQLRIGVLAVVGALVLLASARDAGLLGALIGGIACGTALGYLGLRHTKFEAIGHQRFYTPHTYIGVLVTALFLGRVMFRFLTIYRDAQTATRPNPSSLDAYQNSPPTLAIFGLLLGYYLLFNIGVLRKSRGAPNALV